MNALWTVVTLPFRLVGWVVEMLGRVVGVVLGFGLMVVGMALCAASLFILGVPVFAIGLILALKSL